jgi:hypothetical protein
VYAVQEDKTNLVLLLKAVNPGLCGERPATNCLSHGTTLIGSDLELCNLQPILRAVSKLMVTRHVAYIQQSLHALSSGNRVEKT